jgi:predicted dehydrogenase
VGVAAQETASNDFDGAVPCRVAVVGAGAMAREHLRAFADIPGVVLAGLHSRTRSRAETLAAEFRVAEVYNSIEELHHGTHADLVVVTVPELSMNAVSRSCFRFPWTILLEKPAGFNLHDAEAIACEAGESERPVFVALNRRLYSSTQAAIRDLEGNSARRFIHVRDQQDQSAALAGGQPISVVENWMYANSIHTIDFLRVFGRGRIVDVRAVLPWTPERPDVVVSAITFDSGDVGVYEGIWNGPGPWAVTVSTATRRWELRPLEVAAYQDRGERTLRPVESHPWDTAFKAGFRRQAQLAVDAATGRGGAGLATVADALETMRLIAKIFA